jgi:hypothetical protein
MRVTRCASNSTPRVAPAGVWWHDRRVARSVGDFSVITVRRPASRRGVALFVAFDLAVLASGAGYFVGGAGGGDREAAILSGQRSGKAAGQKAGLNQGYAAGLSAGRRAGVRKTYRPSYQAALYKARKP